jgi:hypothetical protein
MIRAFRTLWYGIKFDVYYPIFRPRLWRAIVESQDELLGSVGWIDIE